MIAEGFYRQKMSRLEHKDSVYGESNQEANLSAFVKFLIDSIDLKIPFWSDQANYWRGYGELRK